jgi:DNA modification methylase
MPSLDWKGKHSPIVAPAKLVVDSILYPGGWGYPKANPLGRLILGDNLAVMAALLPKFEGRINLIYADPPFYTNRKFKSRIGRGEDSRNPRDWKLGEGYHDAWPDLDSYLQFLYERLTLMHRLLAENGTLYLHLDWHADAYARLLLDEIFGSDNLINEIIWAYHGPSPIRTAFNRKHDTILSYSKSRDYIFNADSVREPYHPNTLTTFRSSPKAGFGKVPDLARGKVPEDWWYFPVVARLHKERTGYPTQKPEALLERILLASSNHGDLVADFFCGSGTTPVVAARNGRRFIACDETFRAVHTTRTRLVDSSRNVISLEIASAAGGKYSGRRGRASAKVSKNGVRLVTSLEVDYWEIDPEWDGKIFRSTAQAQRHARSGELALAMKIRTGRHPCIRFVTAQGSQFQLNV